MVVGLFRNCNVVMAIPTFFLDLQSLPTFFLEKKEKKKDKKDKKEGRKEKKEKLKDLQNLPDEEDAEEDDETPAKPAVSKEDKEKEEKRKEKKEKKKEKKKAKQENKEKHSKAAKEETNGASAATNGDADKTINANDIDIDADEAAKPDRHIVFVGNLPFSATAATISAHFASLSPTGVRCLSNKDDKNPCKGIAFVEFGKVWHQRTCLDKFHHSMFDDGVSPARRINVELR